MRRKNQSGKERKSGRLGAAEAADFPGNWDERTRRRRLWREKSTLKAERELVREGSLLTLHENGGR